MHNKSNWDIMLDDDILLMLKIPRTRKLGQCRNPCSLTSIVANSRVSKLKYQDGIDIGRWFLVSELKSRFRRNRWRGCYGWYNGVNP